MVRRHLLCCLVAEFYTFRDFCLDFSIDYCDGTPTPHLRAIINDPDLMDEGASTIFGPTNRDSAGSRVLKQVLRENPVLHYFIEVQNVKRQNVEI
jgi:hypothetical protein